MSGYVVTKLTIDLLVHVALHGPAWATERLFPLPLPEGRLTPTDGGPGTVDPSALGGRWLVQSAIAALVVHRQTGDPEELPGMGTGWEPYRYEPPPRLTAVEAIQAVWCLREAKHLGAATTGTGDRS